MAENKRTQIMGIVNVTPDSFFDGGQYLDPERACEQALRLVAEGADIIDLGGESSRPGAETVSLTTELQRVIPVIEKLRPLTAVPLSIDTSKAEVARQALAAGAKIVNDISALRHDQEMAAVVAEHNVPVIIMHMQGTPKDMQQAPFYLDVIKEIKDFFQERIAWAQDQGIKQENIILDPGIGFGKRLSDNLEILRRLDDFCSLNHPLLIGLSRKSFLGQILGLKTKDRLWGTASAVAIAVMKGANIIRVHDVAVMRQVAAVADTVNTPQTCIL